MTRTIRPSEVKTGMEVEWTHAGITRKCVVSVVEYAGPRNGVKIRTFEGGAVHIPGDVVVTVLSEPAPPQPEEPTAGGARVVVDGRRFLRAENDSLPWVELNVWGWHTWDYLCSLGPVQVVPDQGWTIPDTPEVPERIEEWDTWEDVPEGVTVANPELNYQYRKASGKIQAMIPIGGGVWRETSLPLSDFPGPWTRVTDA